MQAVELNIARPWEAIIAAWGPPDFRSARCFAGRLSWQSVVLPGSDEGAKLSVRAACLGGTHPELVAEDVGSKAGSAEVTCPVLVSRMQVGSRHFCCGIPDTAALAEDPEDPGELRVWQGRLRLTEATAAQQSNGKQLLLLQRIPDWPRAVSEQSSLPQAARDIKGTRDHPREGVPLQMVLTSTEPSYAGCGRGA